MEVGARPSEQTVAGNGHIVVGSTPGTITTRIPYVISAPAMTRSTRLPTVVVFSKEINNVMAAIAAHS
jgi:hypothetical protein